MTLLCRYDYDALNRLTGHTPANEAQLQRFYFKSRLATEIQDTLRLSIVQSGDLLLAQQQCQKGTRNTTLLATDQPRSVLHTLESNNQLQPIGYSPYGHHHPENGSLSLLGFNGERPDPVTGHYLLGNGYRAFNPVLMRFNSPDSLSPHGKGGINAYAYCGGDPINRVDPNGHRWWLARLFTRLFSKKTDFSQKRMWKDLIRTVDTNIAARTPGSRMSPHTMDAIKKEASHWSGRTDHLLQFASDANVTPAEHVTNRILSSQQFYSYGRHNLNRPETIPLIKENISSIDRKTVVLTDLRDGFKHPKAQDHLDVIRTQRIREVSDFNRASPPPPLCGSTAL